MTDLSLTQQWLRQNIQTYSHRDIVYSHVDTVLSLYLNLRPKTDVYTYDDGRSQLLLCVHGLLPILYRGASYNIPVAVWLTHQYPAEPPLVYVVPTSDMLIKAGKFVDVSGRCEPDYIHAWQKKSEGCNLKALLEVLTDQFSQDPPVYAKPQAPSPSLPTPSPVTPDYASRPPPHAPRTNGSPLFPSATPRPAPPPRPPPSVSDHSFRSPAQLPPSPVPHYSRPLQPLRSPPPPPPILDVTFRQLTQSPPPTVPHYSRPPQNVSVVPLTAPHYPPSAIQPEMPLPSPVPAPNYLDEDVEDTPSMVPPPSNAPPRPPNPEVLRLHAQVHTKFNSEFTAFDRALAMDMQRLQTAQADLLAGEPAIRDEMARLEAVREVCRVVADRLRATVHSAEMNLYELRRKGDPEVDELICSTTIVYNQLINLVAEDNAIEDTIYHLHRALNAGRIDLDKFLRTTRALAEEQFMKRALAEKIVSSIPMGAWR